MEVKDLYTMIKTIILKETLYMRQYIAKVQKLDDEDNKGRVFLHIPALNWVDDDSGIWAYPVQRGSLTLPKKDAYVLCFFESGQANRCYYYGSANEIDDMIVPVWSGDTADYILFQDNKERLVIKYNSDDKELIIKDEDNNNIVISSSGITIDDKKIR
jgi:hypothetical protein